METQSHFVWFIHTFSVGLKTLFVITSGTEQERVLTFTKSINIGKMSTCKISFSIHKTKPTKIAAFSILNYPTI